MHASAAVWNGHVVFEGEREKHRMVFSKLGSYFNMTDDYVDNHIIHVTMFSGSLKARVRASG